MRGPEVGPRVKQANQFARLGIESGDVRALEAIAVQTGEREVPDLSRPAVLAAMM